MLKWSDESKLITWEPNIHSDCGCLAQSRATRQRCLGPLCPLWHGEWGAPDIIQSLWHGSSGVKFVLWIRLDLEPTKRKFSIWPLPQLLAPVFSCSFNRGQVLCPKTIEHHEQWRSVCLCQHSRFRCSQSWLDFIATSDSLYRSWFVAVDDCTYRHHNSQKLQGYVPLDNIMFAFLFIFVSSSSSSSSSSPSSSSSFSASSFFFSLLWCAYS